MGILTQHTTKQLSLRPIFTAIALFAGIVCASAQDNTTIHTDASEPLIGRHRISYHYGTIISPIEGGFVRLYRKHTIPVVSIDYSFYFNRHWAIGADAAVYIPNEYRINIPSGYSMLEQEDKSDRNITAGSFMLTGSYSDIVGPIELTGSIGIGFTEFTTKQDRFYLMDNETENIHGMLLQGKSAFFTTIAPMLRISKHLSNTLSIFLETRYNIVMGHSSIRLTYMQEPDVSISEVASDIQNLGLNPLDDQIHPINERIRVKIPSSFSITFGFTLRFGTIK